MQKKIDFFVFFFLKCFFTNFRLLERIPTDWLEITERWVLFEIVNCNQKIQHRLGKRMISSANMTII